MKLVRESVSRSSKDKSLQETFWRNLGDRLKSENDLSDVTWGMCETSPRFRELFLTFFFPAGQFDKAQMEREKSEEDSRADFIVITKTGERFVIEVKIENKNHHFEQYLKTYEIDREHLGYIVNYALLKDGFEVKTWEEFYCRLKKKLPRDKEERELFLAYMGYLESICSIIDIGEIMKVKLEDIHALYRFNQLLRKAVDRKSAAGVLTRESEPGMDDGDWRCGSRFRLTCGSEKKVSIGLWVGIYFDDGNAKGNVCIQVTPEKAELFFAKIRQGIGSFKEGEYAKKPYGESGAYFFGANEKWHKKFNEGKNSEAQLGLLQAFMDEVIAHCAN